MNNPNGWLFCRSKIYNSEGILWFTITFDSPVFTLSTVDLPRSLLFLLKGLSVFTCFPLCILVACGAVLVCEHLLGIPSDSGINIHRNVSVFRVVGATSAIQDVCSAAFPMDWVCVKPQRLWATTPPGRYLKITVECLFWCLRAAANFL